MSTIHLQRLGNIPLDKGFLNQAVGFFNAGSRFETDVKISPLIGSSPMAPAFVCYAFSTELYKPGFESIQGKRYRWRLARGLTNVGADEQSVGLRRFARLAATFF